MLNRPLTIGILGAINLLVLGSIVTRYGLSSINNWLLIVSVFFLSLAIYRILGMVEGYKD